MVALFITTRNDTMMIGHFDFFIHRDHTTSGPWFERRRADGPLFKNLQVWFGRLSLEVSWPR